MVKVSGPMFSLEASGTLADTATFAKWKGRPYVRSRVVPSNPKSAGQTGMRSMFRYLSQIWKSIGASPKATWALRAAAKAVSPFNEFVSYNQLRFRDFKAPTLAFPEATANTPAVAGALSAAAGERTISVTQAITTANDGQAVLFFRSPTGTFTTSWEKLVAVKPIVGTAAVIFIDGPLDPGTYYYDTRLCTKDGQLSAETGEVSETLL
jgi:hypothetical protein